jgi:hypothetical protein
MIAHEFVSFEFVLFLLSTDMSEAQPTSINKPWSYRAEDIKHFMLVVFLCARDGFSVTFNQNVTVKQAVLRNRHDHSKNGLTGSSYGEMNEDGKRLTTSKTVS